MKLAVASGKGGTGKTTVATNLALVASSSLSVQLLDCDVEAPNCHIFVKPKIISSEAVSVPVPKIDERLCTGCGRCGEICEFSAIVCIKPAGNMNGKARVLVFPELCHGCGGCTMACPAGAISETNRLVGTVSVGETQSFDFTYGRLRIGEAMSPPLIRRVREKENGSQLTIVDAPPGTSCPVVSAVNGCDYACLVTEPTPFGLNDLVLAVEMIQQLGVLVGVVVNRCDIGDNRIRKYCESMDIPILCEIPDDRRIAEAYAKGELILEALPDLREVFENLLEVIVGQLEK